MDTSSGDIVWKVEVAGNSSDCHDGASFDPDPSVRIVARGAVSTQPTSSLTGTACGLSSKKQPVGKIGDVADEAAKEDEEVAKLRSHIMTLEAKLKENEASTINEAGPNVGERSHQSYSYIVAAAAAVCVVALVVVNARGKVQS